ncbi:fimbria/pilus outer membrane usher protein [Pantoea sp.]|uniref:fimbria/pilus outer membrane usher protein n=1 Tax=Pantoea sp. TaxID=69393 RepID=UPI00289A068A|nr:fimbria/pilus outer membrane usher protein [Pantoea sp.]
MPFLFLIVWWFSALASATENTGVIFNNDYKGVLSLAQSDGVPCLPRALLEEWGVKIARFSAAEWRNDGCLAATAFRRARLQYWYRPQARLLTVLLPGDWVRPQQNGVSTSRWDDGINAAFVNYRLSATHRAGAEQVWHDNHDAVLELTNGLNVGPWRLRYNSTLWHDERGQWRSRSRERYLARSIRPLRARLLLGDGATGGDQFESIGFTGLSLASDEAMYPDSWRPFSPWINGYARTPAEVIINQNGSRVYRINVQPGTFVIRNFYPPDADGNLELIVRESDGSERQRIIPYSTVPNLVQNNIVSVKSVVGRYRAFYSEMRDPPLFWQGTAAWGILPRLTLFGGMQHARDYSALVAGSGFSLYRWGALSADITLARYQEKQGYRGAAGRLRYARAFFSRQANMHVSLLWYPRQGRFRTLRETLETGSDDELNDRRWRSEIAFNKVIDEDSSLSLGWQHSEQRDRRTTGSSWALTFDGRVRQIEVSLSAGFTHSAWDGNEAAFSLNVSVPISLGRFNASAGYALDYAAHDALLQTVNLSGSALADYRLRYDFSLGRQRHGERSYSASLGYRADGNESNLWLERAGKLRTASLESSGSVLLHAGGVTLGQTLGDTAGLVTIPESPGLAVYNQFGVKSNARGEILVSYLTPWRVNRITLDTLDFPSGLCANVDELDVVPSWGAIVQTRFAKPQQQQASLCE